MRHQIFGCAHDVAPLKRQQGHLALVSETRDVWYQRSQRRCGVTPFNCCCVQQRRCGVTPFNCCFVQQRRCSTATAEWSCAVLFPSSVSYVTPAPVDEYITPALAVNGAPTPVVGLISPAPVYTPHAPAGYAVPNICRGEHQLLQCLALLLRPWMNTWRRLRPRYTQHL